ncbi:MAG: hypothetical protein AB1635_11210 [Acidobacteriota bacterium]
MHLDRRSLIRWIASGAAAWPLRGVRLHAQAAALPDAGVATLRALAPAVLPAELGAAGHARVANDFVRWLASYRPGAERSWGYGEPQKTGTPAISGATYQSQLAALEERARARGGALASLPVDDRRALAAELVEAAGIKAMPGAPSGQHVVTDLLSFYFTSSAANDLCYRARIGRETCRTLKGVTARPEPLGAAAPQPPRGV